MGIVPDEEGGHAPHFWTHRVLGYTPGAETVFKDVETAPLAIRWRGRPLLAARVTGQPELKGRAGSLASAAACVLGAALP
jgi:hypothetical protein